MKKLTKLIIGIIIVIILFIIIMLCFIKKNGANKIYIEDLDNPEDNGKGYQANKTMRMVETYDIYFSAKNILNEYITYFEYINGDVNFDKGRIQLSDEEFKRQQHEVGIRAITQIFDEQYKNSESYDEEKINSYAEKYKNTSGNSHYVLYIDEMYKADVESNCSLILVYSKINNKDFNCMLKMDWDSNRYSIFWDDYLEKNNYTKNRTDDIDINRDIEKGDYNLFIPTYPNNQDIAIKYFDDLKYKIKNNPNELYNTMLDEEYRGKRFPSSDIYIDFLTEINARLNKMDINKYKYEDNQISIVDNYDNIYTFKISQPMKYKVLLDNYTVKNDELTKLYNNAKEEEKINSNIREFFNMVNMKDYNGIYNKLDETFKNNHFAKLNDLKEYIKQNLYDYNIFKETLEKDKDNNNYIYTVSFSNGENKNEEAKEITIVMQLKEGTDYVMSFSM